MTIENKYVYYNIYFFSADIVNTEFQLQDVDLYFHTSIIIFLLGLFYLLSKCLLECI
jgi:hypothetical protein